VLRKYNGNIERACDALLSGTVDLALPGSSVGAAGNASPAGVGKSADEITECESTMMEE
jgi:hypothetical protein